MEFGAAVLKSPARDWLLALGDVELSVTGLVVTVRGPGVETDPDRLRGMLELATAAAVAATP